MPSSVYTTTGGARTASLYSGALAPGLLGAPGAVAPGTGHVLLFSGAGRLRSIISHQSISGVAAIFYDAAVLARSGVATIQESGGRPLAIVGPNTFADVGTLQAPDNQLNPDMPFTSGLCVSFASGCAGFTVSYTSESLLNF